MNTAKFPIERPTAMIAADSDQLGDDRQRRFGDIPGTSFGQQFASRRELAEAGIHRPLVAGISGSRADGADSIVLSGGYEDDEDHGDLIVYTGHGGNDPNTGRQIADQEWSRGNQGLRVSQLRGLPVRVVRGSGLKSDYAPKSGFRYDGLYRVDETWQEIGRSGFRICRFRLIRDQLPQLPVRDNSSHAQESPRRIETTVQRIVRSTTVSQTVKTLNNHTCQTCHRLVVTPGGPYAEAAHIKPLGTPHNGPDVLENVLCLCPTCHVLFDYGAFLIDDNLVVRSAFDTQLDGRALLVKSSHKIDLECIRYHCHLHQWDTSSPPL